MYLINNQPITFPIVLGNVLYPDTWVFTAAEMTAYGITYQADSTSVLLQAALALKSAELSSACDNEIYQGFQSSALGTLHFYDNADTDQLNLLQAIAATSPTTANPSGTSINHACTDVSSGTKSFILHTHDQLVAVAQDGANFKIQLLEKLATKQAHIQSLPTAAAVNAITWTSNP